LVDIGARVEAGQLMAELETPEIDRELSEDRADLKQAEAAKGLAKATAKRWTQMLSGNTVSAQEAEEKTSDLSLKEAAVESAGAKVERLQELTGFARITAPFAGTVTARNLDIGQLVDAGGSRELFRVAKTDRLRVFVRVPQSYTRSVTAGQRAELTVPEMPERKFEATIVRDAGAIDAASRTLLTELEVDNAKGELLAGSYASIRLTEAHPEVSMTIPSNCLLFRAEGPQVGIVDASHHVELRSVTVGRDLGATIEIVKGVAMGDQLVLNPPDALVTGIEVRVNPSSAKK
jgi:RND family efflux transporter MFP subunit